MANHTRSAAHQPSNRLIVVFALAVLGLYVLALFCPAFLDDGWAIADGPPSTPCAISGWGALVLGWAWDRSIWAWFANLFLVAALLCFPKKRFGWACSCAYMGTALAATSWFAGRPLLIGYYLWQASFIVLAIGAHWAYLQHRREEDPHGPQNRLDVPPPVLNGLQESSRVP
jgi:hypothetical protein